MHTQVTQPCRGLSMMLGTAVSTSYTLTIVLRMEKKKITDLGPKPILIPIHCFLRKPLTTGREVGRVQTGGNLRLLILFLGQVYRPRK